jgi:excisionase family DNA binding protein
VTDRLVTAAKLAVSPEQAAAMLSMSRDHFDRFVRDELRVIRAGRKVIVPVAELERWLERSAARTLEGDGT